MAKNDSSAQYSALGINYKPPKYSSTNAYSSDDAFKKAQDAANKANELRYQQGLGLWDKIVAAYQPGGSFGQGAMASYEQGKTETLGSSAQQLISSGLYGTTTGAMLGAGYEAKVGSPFRLNLADLQTKGYTQGLAGAAGYISGKEELPPDPALYAQLKQKAATGYGRGAIPEQIPQNPYLQDISRPMFGGNTMTSPMSPYTPRYSESPTATTAAAGAATADTEPTMWDYGLNIPESSYTPPDWSSTADPYGGWYGFSPSSGADPFLSSVIEGGGSLGGSWSGIPTETTQLNTDYSDENFYKQMGWID